MLLRFQKAAVRGNYGTGNQAFSLRLRFLTMGPKAFKKDSSGRIRAVADRYLRRLEIPGPDRPIVVKIRGYKAKSEMARFRNDVFSFLGGDQTALNKWKGVRIQGHELLTDPRIIRVLGEQDNLPEHFGSEQVIPYSSGAS
jgi:hypothetical protein